MDAELQEIAAPVPTQAPKANPNANHAPVAAPNAGNATRQPKREFDRHSGTGRGREVSKGGAGRHAWGNPKDPKTELENETAATGSNDAADRPAESQEEPIAQLPPTYTMEEFARMKAQPTGEMFKALEVRAVDAAGKVEIIKRVEEELYLVDPKKANKKKKQGPKKENFFDVYELPEEPPRQVQDDATAAAAAAAAANRQRRDFNGPRRDGRGPRREYDNNNNGGQQRSYRGRREGDQQEGRSFRGPRDVRLDDQQEQQEQQSRYSQ